MSFEIGSSVLVELYIHPCTRKGKHPWHICKPGGSEATVCPGKGDYALPEDVEFVKPMHTNNFVPRGKWKFG